MNREQGSARWLLAGLLAVALIFPTVTATVPLLINEYDPFKPQEFREIEPIELVLELPEEEEQEEPDDQDRQIVSINAPATVELPDEARFEDRVNRSVEEETAARERGRPGAVANVPSPAEEGRRPRRRQEESLDEQTTPDETQEDEQVAAILDPTNGDRTARSASPLDPDDPNASQPPVEETNDLELAAFRPTFERASDVISVPGAGSMDHLDLPPGERDQINSFENMYWSYWERLKNQVRPHWLPARAYRERDPSGRVFGVEDRYTVLRVTLNGDGSLRHVYLERSSDLDFLDRVAVSAIRDAQPFANVPEGLKDERGLLSFRFGFYFEVSSRSFRIRREDW